MIVARRSVAQSTSSWRRPGPRTPPVGDWCAGVSRAARADVAASALDHHALLVDRHRDGVEARAPRDGLLVDVAGVLDRHRPDPVGRERAQDERDALGEAGADHDPLRVDDGATDPPQVRREYLAQLGAAARIAVAERVRRRGAADLAQRPQPVLPRETW